MLNNKISDILRLLDNHYPDSKIALKFSGSWQLLVSVILSAQCTDVTVNRVTGKLFWKYPLLDDYVNADLVRFEKDIKSTGFYKNKARNIISAANKVKNNFAGEVPKTMDELLTLPGVARKTANVVLGNAFGKVSGIAVDTHVLRLSQRLRLVDAEKLRGSMKMTFLKNGTEFLDFKKNADPVEIEFSLMETIPRKKWFSIAYQLIDHGRAICRARNPKCQSCPLKACCPSFRL